MPDRFLARWVKPDSPQPDSSAAWATVKLAGIWVWRALAHGGKRPVVQLKMLHRHDAAANAGDHGADQPHGSLALVARWGHDHDDDGRQSGATGDSRRRSAQGFKGSDCSGHAARSSRAVPAPRC